MLYAYDPPARAASTALIDCSYGDYQTPLQECWHTMAALIERGPLPVPANGRGPEIALELMRHGFGDNGIDDIFVDEAMRKALQQLGDRAGISLRDDVGGEIERLTAVVKPIVDARGVMLAASADGASGATARLLPRFEQSSAVTILFTGHINPDTPAERLTKSGRAQTMRWNVHPLVSNTVALVRATRAKTVIPAFCDRAKLAALANALAPAHVTMDGPIEI